MPERMLEAFRDEAERLTELPDFESIERRGRALRRRRQALVATVAASVLVVTGILATAGGVPRTQHPTTPDAPSLAFPSFDMVTLAEGTYHLAPSVNPARPLVRFTVPAGWNSWQGPNLFEGIGPEGTDNEDVLDATDWYAGMLVLEVEKMAGPHCRKVDVRNADATEFVQALTRIPHLKVTSGPLRTTHFEHSATHLRLRQRTSPPACPEFTFSTLINETIGLATPDARHDAWVIDLDDRPLLVWATWTRGTPRAGVADLMAIVDSIEVLDRS